MLSTLGGAAEEKIRLIRQREVEEGKQAEDRRARARVELNLFTIITLLHCVYINKVGFVR